MKEQKKKEIAVKGEKKASISTKRRVLIIFAILVCTLVVTVMATNSEIREKLINTITGKSQKTETQVYDDRSIELTDDTAIVSSASVVNRITGTEGFDDNDEPGNDSSADNEVVRSFDKVTWQVEAVMEINNSDHGSEDAQKYNKFRGGTIYIEAKLPEEYAGLMKWSLEDMSWIKETGELSEDGLTLKASYTMNKEQVTVPGKQGLSLVLDIDGAGNGMIIDPEFKVWMQGNESDKEKDGYEAVEFTDGEEKVSVSAKAGFNIKLVDNDFTGMRRTVNFNDGEGEKLGRIYGYAIILQLYNEDKSKGLKGLEYPKGDITFDIEAKIEAEETIDGKKVRTDITDLAMPQLWNYRINVGWEAENPAWGNIPDRNMYFSNMSQFNTHIAPYGKYKENINVDYVYNSGNILINEQDNILHTTINNYEFNGEFPKHNAYVTENIDYADNIGCFSVGYVQIFIPDNKETTDKNKNYFLTVEDKNMNINTISNETNTKQVIEDDDTLRIKHYAGSIGEYSHNTETLGDEKTPNIITKSSSTIIHRNQNFQIRTLITQDYSNDIGTEIKSINRLIKFDGDGLEPILYDDGEKAHFSTEDMTWKIWYVTKEDGSNWINEDERKNTNVEDLNLYDTLQDIPNGYTCVGMYFESQGGTINIPTQWGEHYIMIRMRAKNSAQLGNTYGVVQDDYWWTETLDRTTQTAINKEAKYPTPVFKAANNEYLKTKYDKEGYIIEGTRNAYFGTTILVSQANSKIMSKAIDEKTQEEKTSYDLANNENKVTLKVEPTLEELDKNNPANVKGATIRVKETLPKELTYIAGTANYGEPVEKIENEDGSKTLIWEKYNCNVGEEITPLIFQAEIDPNTANETTLKITSVIEPDREKIGLTSLDIRTTTTEIKVINLTSHRIYKTVETPIIEANGEIKYKVTYQNKTNNSTPDFQLLDILPYNGDGRNTAYNGTYVLKDVKVTQTNESGNTNTDNLSLYTTTNIEARKISPKDEGIGISEIWNKKEIGKEINEPVTVLALKGEIEANTKIEMEITLKTSNNRAGDKYANTVTAQTNKETAVINTAEVETKVVTRQIEGKIWYDTNENGVKDEEEEYANRIEVELKKADGSKATDANGNEIQNILTDSEGEYVFSNLPKGEYKVEIHTEEKYKLTRANVGSNKEINSKFEENEKGEKESYTITNLNSIESPELIENNVNAGLVVKDAKIIVKYLEEDNTPETDEDNKVLKEQMEITQYEKDGKQVNYKIGDNYETKAEEIENYISIRNSQNTNGVLNAEETIVTYYYTYNKQDITINKIWKDNNNEAGKRPTSIKVTLKDGNNKIGEQVISAQDRISIKQNTEEIADPENTWVTTIKDVPIYRENGEKITYTVDEEENEGTLDSYIKTIEGTIITNTFTQNTEKTQVEVTKKWEDNNNKAQKRPESLVLILKKEVKATSGESQYQEVRRTTINGTENKGENENEWKYTFNEIPKYDENNDEIKYKVEEEKANFYEASVKETENNKYEVTNTFKVPDEKISIEITKIWEDNNNRAEKRPESVTLELSGNSQKYSKVLTQEDKTVENENIWKATITNLPKYDENADEIEYILSEENTNNIFYTQENAEINQQTKTVTNKFEVPDEKIKIEVNKKWEDNNNNLQKRPESVTIFLTGSNQEYETTLTEENKQDENESIWSKTIENLPKYDINGNIINYVVDERPIASEFYSKTEIDEESKTVSNTFAIPTESIQIGVTKIWEDENNKKGKRPESIVMQIKEKGTEKIIKEQTIQGSKTTNEGWNYIFEVPKYNEEGQIVEYEIGEKELNNKFYPTESTIIEQDTKTITNKYTVPDEKIEIKVNKVWVDNETQAQRRPEKITIQIKGENGEIVDSYEMDSKTEDSHTFTNLAKYNKEGDEIEYTANEINESKFYTKQIGKTVESGENQKTIAIANIFTKPEEKTKITVNKVWNDNEIQSQRRPESVIIEVKDKQEDKVIEEKEITKDNKVEGTENQWAITFEGLEKYNENGEEKEYEVDEKEKNEGELKFYTKEVTKVEDNQATIRNTFTKPGETTNKEVIKIWNDNNNESGKRPEKIKVQLKNKNGQVAEKEITQDNKIEGTEKEEIIDIVNEGKEETQKLDLEKTEIWKTTFENLEKYNENGEEIAYTTDETEVNSGDLQFYEKEIDGLEITNTFKVPDEKISVKVNKEWIDNETQEQRRPESVILVLKQKEENATNNVEETTGENKENNTEENWKEIARQEITELNSVQGNKDNWEYTFENLAKYDNKGNKIEYKVEEQEKTEGDLDFYTSKVENVENETEEGKETENKTIKITNTFTKPEETTNKEVIKIWNDNNNKAEKRPESIKVQLKNGNEQVQEKEITEENKIEGTEKQEILDKINEGKEETAKLDKSTTQIWKTTFENLEKYNENGEEIKYTADETEVKSGDLQFYEKEMEETNIINTFTQNTEKTKITVTKKWEDNEIQSKRRPESVIIEVKNGNDVVQSQEITKENKVGEDNSTWQYTFTNLAKYDENNNIINYTIDEKEKQKDDLKFYEKSINGTTITNKYKTPEDTIEIKVSKKWEDQENTYKKRPEVVTIQVKNGNQIIDEKTTTEKENWEATFKNLDKYNENGEEIKYKVDEGELIGDSQIYYEKEVGEVESQGTNTKEAIITNKMTKYPSMVIVKYKDKNTGKEIHSEVEKEGILGEKYDVTEDKKGIAGYTLVEEPEEKTGIYTEEAQEKTYYYAKNTKVTIKYLEKDKTEEDTDNEVVVEEEILEGYEGKEYKTEEKEIEGYTYIESKGQEEGKMAREESEVIYYYAKNTQVKVKYLEQDNTPGDDTDNKVLEEEIIKGYEGKEYQTEEKKITGYTYITSTDNTKGTMTKEEIEVIYYYAQNTKVTVKYLEKGTNKKLAEEVIIEGYEGKEYKTEEKKIEGYTYVESTENTEGKMSKIPIEVKYYYAQNTTVRIQHIDKETGEILKETIENGKVGDICKTHAEDIEGYEVVEKPKQEEIEMTKQEQIVKYYYAHISQGVLEKHIDEITGEILYTENHKGNEGDTYEIKEKTFEGYDLVKEKRPTNAKGEMTKELIEVKYYYIKKAKVIVEYKEKETEEKLAEDVIIEGHENDTYKTEAKEIKGYNLKETPENAEGKMKVTKNEDGSNNIETKVTYYYIKQAGTVTENHIDINSGKILKSKTHEGNVGDSYEIKPEEIEGYDLVTEKLPTNAKGEMTEEKIEVNYYYKKLTAVKVEYIDKGTGEIIEEEKIEGHEGDKYETEEKEYEGYDLIEKPSNSKGEMEGEEIVVKYYYARKAKVEIRYVEKGTEYEIEEREEIQGHVGDKYETKAKNIAYYKQIGQTENIEGTMTIEPIIVTYYYEKQTFNLGIETWIDKVSINGLSQNAQNESQKEEIYKIDIHRNKIETAQIQVRYKIKIKNTGEIEGQVERLTEIMPKGFSYYQEDNEISWKEEDGILTTDDLKGETIKAGEEKEIEIELRWNGGENNLGEKDSTAIISKTTNPAGYEETTKEDNSSKSKMIITVATGLDSNDRIILTGALQILILLAIGLMFGRKQTKKRH